jgi:hypothetical protein
MRNINISEENHERKKTHQQGHQDHGTCDGRYHRGLGRDRSVAHQK